MMLSVAIVANYTEVAIEFIRNQLIPPKRVSLYRKPADGGKVLRFSRSQHRETFLRRAFPLRQQYTNNMYNYYSIVWRSRAFYTQLCASQKIKAGTIFFSRDSYKRVVCTRLYIVCMHILCWMFSAEIPRFSRMAILTTQLTIQLRMSYVIIQVRVI